MERRGTTRDTTARGIVPDLRRWQLTSFVGIVSHLLGGTSHPQVLGSSPTGPTSFPLAALCFWDGVRRERLIFGADCVTSEEPTRALLRGRTPGEQVRSYPLLRHLCVASRGALQASSPCETASTTSRYVPCHQSRCHRCRDVTPRGGDARAPPRTPHLCRSEPMYKSREGPWGSPTRAPCR
jgi:hypothetical protein